MFVVLLPDYLSVFQLKGNGCKFSTDAFEKSFFTDSAENFQHWGIFSGGFISCIISFSINFIKFNCIKMKKKNCI